MARFFGHPVEWTVEFYISITSSSTRFGFVRSTRVGFIVLVVVFVLRMSPPCSAAVKQRCRGPNAARGNVSCSRRQVSVSHEDHLSRRQPAVSSERTMCREAAASCCIMTDGHGDSAVHGLRVCVCVCVCPEQSSPSLANFITFCVSRRRRKMYCGHARLCVCVCVCLCVCLSVCPRPYADTTARTRM